MRGKMERGANGVAKGEKRRRAQLADYRSCSETNIALFVTTVQYLEHRCIATCISKVRDCKRVYDAVLSSG